MATDDTPDYLDAWPLIMDRLADTALCPALRDVRPGTELSAALGRIAEPGDRTAYVYYDGDSLGEDADGGWSQMVQQRYQIVLAWRQPRTIGPERPDPALGQALGQILVALQGWSPWLDQRRLYRSRAAVRPSYPPELPGWGLFPLVFETPGVIEGVDDE